jgi:hypothetical protein
MLGVSDTTHPQEAKAMSDNSGLSADQAENMKTVQDGIKSASDTFNESVEDAGPAEFVEAFGKYISDLADPVGDFGDGLGDTLEESIQKGFGSEDVGTGFLSETAEAVFSVIGEATEGITEMTGGLADAVMEATGGVVEAVGGAAGNLWDAGGSLLDGDVGGAVDHVVEAVKDAAGIVEVAIDTGGALVHAVGEGVEGIVETAWEAGEGVVEMGIGLGRNIADGAEYVGEALGDAADAVGETFSDAADAVGDAFSDAAGAVADYLDF